MNASERKLERLLTPVAAHAAQPALSRQQATKRRRLAEQIKRRDERILAGLRAGAR